MRSLLLATLAVAACSSPSKAPVPDKPEPPADLRDPREVHLADIQQLSDGGENAEAYWSNDGTQLIFQTKREPYACDQIMRTPADGSSAPVMVSNGDGRTTCSYFLSGDQEVIYSSTHETDKACPPEPDHSKGYVWAIYDSYDIYRAGVDGSNPRKLTDRVGYDAEATVCRTDNSIIFTSDRDGDIELYRMDADGNNVVRLTHTPGYDGGAFFSDDCSKIVWRASRPTGDDLEEFRALLAQHLVRPSKLELYVANADGTDARQVTYLDAASFGPYLFPSGDRIIFSSNTGSEDPREFDLWAIDTDGTDLERITYSGGFDGFPMFSPDGTRLAFASNRHNRKEGETNLFVAKWIDSAPVTEESAADRFDAMVDYLADDARGGRGVGSEGIAKAADKIEEALRAAGVSPGMKDGGFRQPFEVVTSIERGADTAVTLDGVAVAADAFVPLSFSSSKTVEGAIVDVGYGLAGDYTKKTKAKGKIVLVRRFTPADAKFTDDAEQRRESDLHTKVIRAREQGAIGMIVVDTPAEGTAEAALPTLGRDLGDLGMPAVVVTGAAAAKVLKGTKHTARLAVTLTPTKQTTDNIVGVIRATGTRKDGAIVVGAHYDHLGMGGADALDAEPGIHNGADDNASGVAALVEVARTLAASPLGRDVWILAFSAEELGDLGSSYLIKNPPFDQPVIAMLNMDMVGRMRANHLEVLGVRSAKEWADVVVPACNQERVDCALSGDGYGPSDHMMFYVAGAPVLHFFTGSHLDYHTATDDADKINAAGGAAVARIVAASARALAERDGALTYQTAPAPDQGGDARGWGASMGTVPTYDDDPSAPPGMILADVVPDGPAAKAGMKGGDRIVEIGTTEVRNVYDLMYVLEHAKPGDVTKVTYIRGTDRVTVEVTFGKPRSRR